MPPTLSQMHKVDDMVANMMADMEVDKVADKKWIKTHGKKRMGEQNGLREHLVYFFENTWYICALA